MRFLLRQIDRTAAGREIVRERALEQDSLTIGRSAENDIPLPDLAVEQHHVRIEPATDGQLRITAVAGLGFAIDGRTTESATIDPREGAELALGSYHLDLAADGAGEVTVTIRRVEPEEGRRSEALSGFSLAGVLPGKRPLSWLALAAILIAFLAIPIVSHQQRTQAEPDLDGPDGVLLDASWQAGALSSAHHGLEDNCEACHVEAFVAVRDETCLTCHQDIGDHAAPPRLTLARGPLALGDRIQADVAALFHKPAAGACTDCHTEHEGAGRMEPVRQQFCANCHGTLDARLTDSTLGNAADFGRSHPQFKAAVFTAPGQSERQRMSLARQPKQWTGLRFPHDLHLDPAGGVARMASRLGSREGYGSSLECADCHQPTADGVRFLPVSMEDSCEACHSLAYDRVGSTFRTLRHGDIEQMRADLAAADRSPRRPIVTGRRRPGEFAPGGLYYGEFAARGGGGSLVSRALSLDGVCGECHLPTTVDGRPGVMPVLQPSRYFVHGWFDHADHKQEDCTSCHAADTSSASSDLLLPGIAQCRTCHLGEEAREAEVPSGCAMCHSYHPREGAPVGSSQLAMRKED